MQLPSRPQAMRLGQTTRPTRCCSPPPPSPDTTCPLSPRVAGLEPCTGLLPPRSISTMQLCSHRRQPARCTLLIRATSSRLRRASTAPPRASKEQLGRWGRRRFPRRFPTWPKPRPRCPLINCAREASSRSSQRASQTQCRPGRGTLQTSKQWTGTNSC